MMSSAGIAAVTSIAVSSGDKYWWDVYHKYFTFGPEYTNRIDAILSDPEHGKLGPFIILSPGNHIPGVGVHRYFVNRKLISKSLEQMQKYVGLEKIRLPDSNQCYYLAWISPLKHGQEAFQDLESKIIQVSETVTQVISIDMTGKLPQLVGLTKICHPPWPQQQVVIDAMLSQWPNTYNVKTLICGPRGCGKTYTGILIKQALSKQMPASHIRLYDDVDLSAPNLNLNTLILNYASEKMPIILVINDVNVLYAQIVNFSHHYRNKASLNNVLDAIGTMRYVLTIFTSEVSYEDLYQTDGYRSFLRPGRIDLLAMMTDQTCQVQFNL